MSILTRKRSTCTNIKIFAVVFGGIMVIRSLVNKIIEADEMNQ